MTAEGKDGDRNPSARSTTGPAAPGVNVKVRDARSKPVPASPVRHPASGRFRPRQGGRKGR
jgi:hypothetical protein